MVRNSSPPASSVSSPLIEPSVLSISTDGHVAGAHRGHEVGVGDRIGVAGASQQRTEEQHAEGEAQQRPQAPAGHSLAREAAAPRPTRRRGRRGRQTLRAHGEQDTGRVPRIAVWAKTLPGSTRPTGAVDSVPAMSSRTCAKPGCNTSASATLTYDYARPHGVGRAPERRGAPDALRPLRRSRRRPHGPGWALQDRRVRYPGPRLIGAEPTGEATHARRALQPVGAQRELRGATSGVATAPRTLPR